LVNGLLAPLSVFKRHQRVTAGLVHRLDKDYLGSIGIARNDRAHRHLADQLVDHAMHREYYALVKGTIEENEGIINAPIGRDPKRRQQMAVTPHHSKEAETRFQVIARFAGYTLLSVALKTGRTHLIRVLLSYIKHPSSGDRFMEGMRPALRTKVSCSCVSIDASPSQTLKSATYEARCPSIFKWY
jgi:23S rRNA pseudouridine1911/1915/1917 synthase